MASSPTNLWALLGLGLAGILLMTRKLKKAVREDLGAFVERLQLLPPPQPAPPKAPHLLTGLSFSVSDLFHIDGYVTGFGNLDWARTHEAASETVYAVLTLLEGGATCVGKTVVDEMASSITGENQHYGTPTNPAAPAIVPGGSLSGATVAAAAVHMTGVDTVGGVRLPAGFCGVIGFRFSHGSVSPSGFIPVSESLDAVGCFAKDPSVLCHAVHVLLQIQFATSRNPRQFLIADDCFELNGTLGNRIAHPVIKSIEKLFGRQTLKHQNLGDYIGANVPGLREFSSFDCGVKIYYDCSAEDDGDPIPTFLDLPPKLGGKMTEYDQIQLFSLLSVTSMSGCCQATIPLGYHVKCPVSVSFIARHGSDRFLVNIVQKMYASLQEEGDLASKSKLSANLISTEMSAETAKEKLSSSRDAESDCSKAIGLDKKNVKAYLRRGTAREMLGYYI